MKMMMYQDWTRKRINKIINIFGENWFLGKRILELGSCHGDIGIHFYNLGSVVDFSDVREQYLIEIKEKFKQYNITPNTILLNQESKYDLNINYDLVLHLSVLYNLENWKQDLECALNHSKMMILETVVHPVPYQYELISESWDAKTAHYSGVSAKKICPSEKSIEKHLTSLGCKFLKFKDSCLNSHGWSIEKNYIYHDYNWEYSNLELLKKHYFESTKNIANPLIHHRRMWLVIR
jgi:hypothetical protein